MSHKQNRGKIKMILTIFPTTFLLSSGTPSWFKHIHDPYYCYTTAVRLNMRNQFYKICTLCLIGKSQIHVKKKNQFSPLILANLQTIYYNHLSIHPSIHREHFYYCTHILSAFFISLLLWVFYSHYFISSVFEMRTISNKNIMCTWWPINNLAS